MENHLNICNQFVPYELAVKLKELGFDEPCLAIWAVDAPYGNTWLKVINKLETIDDVFAPLWQQAFDWFREKGYDGEIYPTASGYRWTISKSAINPNINIIGGTWVCDSGFHGPNDSGAWDTYEQARQACLEKLIELVKGA